MADLIFRVQQAVSGHFSRASFLLLHPTKRIFSRPWAPCGPSPSSVQFFIPTYVPEFFSGTPSGFCPCSVRAIKHRTSLLLKPRLLYYNRLSNSRCYEKSPPPPLFPPLRVIRRNFIFSENSWTPNSVPL